MGKGKARKRDTKYLRHKFIMDRLKKGDGVFELEEKVCKKFDVVSSTYQADIKHIGMKARKVYQQDWCLDLEVHNMVQRLKQRAQREDNVGNQADGILSRFFSSYVATEARMERDRVEREKLQAQKELWKLKLEAERRKQENDVAWQQEFLDVLKCIRETGQVSFKDVLKLTSLYFDRQVSLGDAGSRNVLETLRLLSQIAREDSMGKGASDQLFRLPDGMALLDFTPDTGDDLVE